MFCHEESKKGMKGCDDHFKSTFWSTTLADHELRVFRRQDRSPIVILSKRLNAPKSKWVQILQLRVDKMPSEEDATQGMIKIGMRLAAGDLKLDELKAARNALLEETAGPKRKAATKRMRRKTKVAAEHGDDQDHTEKPAEDQTDMPAEMLAEDHEDQDHAEKPAEKKVKRFKMNFDWPASDEEHRTLAHRVDGDGAGGREGEVPV